jgi:hypothetical protein
LSSGGYPLPPGSPAEREVVRFLEDVLGDEQHPTSSWWDELPLQQRIATYVAWVLDWNAQAPEQKRAWLRARASLGLPDYMDECPGIELPRMPIIPPRAERASA